MPFCWATLRRVRCPIGPYFTEKNGYPTSPKTIGEMIRKRRLDLGLRQAEAAKTIGCDKMTVVNWEKGHRAPRINHLSGVVKFLGFDPFANVSWVRPIRKWRHTGTATGQSSESFRCHPSGVRGSTRS